MPAPRRLGLVSIHALCRKIVQLFAKFSSKLAEWLTSDEYAKIVALIECCNNVLTNVPQYPTDPPS